MNQEITNFDPMDAVREMLSDVWNRCMSADEAADKLDDIISAAVAAAPQPEAVSRTVPSDKLKRLSDEAYVRYIQTIKEDVCLGWRYKARRGEFGVEEYAAHKQAHVLLGRHQAFAEAHALLERYGQPAATIIPGEIHDIMHSGTTVVLFMESVEAARSAYNAIEGAHRVAVNIGQPAASADLAVPDGVWEALQRLIENAAVLGPASREDARVVLQYRDRKTFLRSAPAAAQPDLRDELNRLGMTAHAAMNQDARDQRNILEDLADRLLALGGGGASVAAQTSTIKESSIVAQPAMRVRVVHQYGLVMEPSVESTSAWFDGLPDGTEIDLYAAQPVVNQSTEMRWDASMHNRLCGDVQGFWTCPRQNFTWDHRSGFGPTKWKRLPDLPTSSVHNPMENPMTDRREREAARVDGGQIKE